MSNVASHKKNKNNVIISANNNSSGYNSSNNERDVDYTQPLHKRQNVVRLVPKKKLL